LSSGLARAQVPAGGEFQINVGTLDHQFFGTMTSLRDGGFIVFWSTSADVIWGRRYDAAGAPTTGEFRVDASTTATQWNPSVSADSGGGFIVAWRKQWPGSLVGVARRFDAAGVPRGEEFTIVESEDVYGVTGARVSARTDGSFVAAYSLAGPTPLSGSRCGYRLFDATGSLVCSSVCPGPGSTSAAMLPDGGFAGVYGRAFLTPPYEIHPRRFDGACQGPELAFDNTPRSGVPSQRVNDRHPAFLARCLGHQR
jgi:hypothetical protein